MRQRIISILFVSLMLTFALTMPWTAESARQTQDDASNVIISTEPNHKKGNRFARIFKSPFKAISKLFGNDEDDTKPRRMSEKDVKKFENSSLVGINDRRTSGPQRAAASGTPGSLTERDRSTPADLTLSKRDALEYLALGRQLLDGETLNEAIAELSRAASLDPGLGEAHNLLGVAFDRKGLHELAQKSYERALRVKANDAQTLNNLGYSLYLNGNYRAALKRLSQAMKLASNDQRILNNLALVQCRLGKYDEAFKTFTHAGGELNAHLNTAAMLERTGRDMKALTHYEAAHRLESTSTIVAERLAALYSRTGRRAEADAVKRAFTVASTSEIVAGGTKQQ